MDGRAARAAFAVGAAALAVICVAGCSLFAAGGGTSLNIVAQVQINQNGDIIGAPEDAVNPPNPSWPGDAVCPPLSIAMAGPLTGSDGATGIDIKNGIQLAVDQHNAATAGCQVQLKAFDTEGNPEIAAAKAAEIVRDVYTMGLIGPVLSEEAGATGAIFNASGMVAVTPSASNVALADNGWQTFFRGLANDGVQGVAVANYMKKHLGSTKVCVVDDGSSYGVGLGIAVRETLGPVADPACAITVTPDTDDYSDVIGQIADSSPDSVFFAGYYSESAPFLRQLREAGVTADFVSGDGSMQPEFVGEAGESASETVLSCSCRPPPQTFADTYTEHFGQPPGTYSAGSYDLGTILLRGLDAEALTRPELLDFVRTYDGQGLERTYQWTDTGELTTTLIWIYRIE
ncbi:MAG: branched-chain amino acid ABC transporter substrate-binding protein [Mycobacterium sp.]